MRPAPEKCFITGLPTIDRPTQFDTIDYYIHIGNAQYHFQFNDYLEPSPDIIDSHHIFIGLILNNKINLKGNLNNDTMSFS